MKKMWRKTKRLLVLFYRNLSLFLYGSFQFSLRRHVEKEMARRMDLFIVICFGDLIGLPVPNYLGYKLLPLFLKELPFWQRRMARGKKSIYDRMAEIGGEF